MFGMPKQGDIDYSEVVELDLASIKPAVSGPRRPHDRLELPEPQAQVQANCSASRSPRTATRHDRAHLRDGVGATNGAGGAGLRPAADSVEMVDKRVPTSHRDGHRRRPGRRADFGYHVLHEHIRNPGVLLGAGLLAKKAVEKGLTVIRASKLRWDRAHSR